MFDIAVRPWQNVLQRDMPRCNHCQLTCLHGGSYLHRRSCSRLSERILILVFLSSSHKFSRYRGDCRLAAPTDFIRGISAGKKESFRLEWQTRILNQWLPLLLQTYLTVLNGIPTEDGHFMFIGVVKLYEEILIVGILILLQDIMRSRKIFTYDFKSFT